MMTYKNCRYFQKLKQPAIYQGKIKPRKYFEGWYFKLVDQTGENVYAIIPGISADKNGNIHTFIQLFDGKSCNLSYSRYAFEDWSFSTEKFEIKIAQNYFSSEKIILDINQDGNTISGSLNFDVLIPWPFSFFSPGTMGPFRYIPFMECYHGVIGFNHSISGSLTINGREIDFSNGKGYMEKDYGTSFPQYYIWMQSNHFTTNKASIIASIAKIPWLGFNFDGFLVGFYLNERVYTFTTYNLSKITYLRKGEATIEVHFENRKYKLELKAEKGQFSPLISPASGAMTGRILESMTAKIAVKLFEKTKAGLTPLFDETGLNAGLDIGGKIEMIKEIGV